MSLHEDVFIENGCVELSPMEFYRHLFFFTKAYMKYRDSMLVPVTFSEESGGSWASVPLGELEERCQGHRDAYLSACTYFPRRDREGRWQSSNGKDMVDELCAFVVDLDHGDPDEVHAALSTDGCYWELHQVPEPTYVVCSGNGLHLYYALETPVPVMKRWVRELEVINRWLYRAFADGDEAVVYADGRVNTIGLGSPDYHGIAQPYRVAGSLPKAERGDSEVSAWVVGRPVSIEYLATCAGLEQTSFTVEGFDLSKSLLTQRIEEGRATARSYVKKTSRRGWNPGFYRWLADQERGHARLYGEFGHRYKQVQALTIAAVKDGVPREQLVADVKAIHEEWNKCAKKYGHPEISWSECRKAMRSFGDLPDHRRFPKWWLEELCGWPFGTQKRNGRDQGEHLKRSRAIRKAYLEAGVEDASGGGRPTGSGTKRQMIQDYAATHPEANHSEIARALGVSRPTVIKWLRTHPEGDE